MVDLDLVQQRIGYNFNDTMLLRTALVHRSYVNDRSKPHNVREHNERLEFLGDAVLELVVTDYLYKQMDEGEGLMTSLRSALVNHKSLSQVGQNLGLEEMIFLSRGEKEELGKARLSIVADAMEAVIGAIYLDGGIEPATNFIQNNILIELPKIIENELYKDPKTKLQEYSQKVYKLTPSYRMISSEGKDHEKIFVSGVWLDNQFLAQGEGNSKQLAETEAAQAAFEILKNYTENEQQNQTSQES